MPGLFIEKHTQSFTSKFNTDINTLRGNKCEWLSRNQPFTFLSFLKFTHSVASLTHPSSTHPSLSLQEVRKVISDISSIATPSLATLPSVVQKVCQARWDTLYCPSSKFGCTAKNPVQHAQKSSNMNILTASYSDAQSELKLLLDSASFIFNWGYLQNTS